MAKKELTPRERTELRNKLYLKRELEEDAKREVPKKENKIKRFRP